jgi:hypothetical protein
LLSGVHTGGTERGRGVAAKLLEFVVLLVIAKKEEKWGGGGQQKRLSKL